MIRNALLLLAALLSVTLPAPPQLTLDRRAEISGSDVGLQCIGILEDLAADKSDKRADNTPDKSAGGPSDGPPPATVALGRLALRAPGWPVRCAAEPIAAARAPAAPPPDARRAVRRHRTSSHVPRMADDDHPAA